MATPTYDADGKRVRQRRARGGVMTGVGPYNAGFLHFREPKRGDHKGQYVANPGGARLIPEAWRWASLKAYHKGSLAGPIQELTRNIDGWIKHLQVQSAAVAQEALGPTFLKSQIYCPKDTHDLVLSGRLTVDAAKNPGDVVKVRIGYGVTGFPFYAVYVHEILSYKHENGTRAKFLESAINEDLGSIRETLERGMTSVAGGR